MKISVSRRNRGFSLLELLVVLLIIGLLAGLVGQRLFTKVDESKITTAQAQIRNFKGALETMRLDISRFPTQEEGLQLLTTAPTDDRIKARWRGPYLDEAVPLDPWGNPYQYSLPGTGGQPYALYSFGADGKRGGEGNDADIGYLPPQ
jgi:general secretion pathway protein G